MRTTMKKLMIVGCLLFIVQLSCGQQDVQHTQFMWDQSAINPAYVGFKESLSANLFLRQQWVGIDGAPKSEYVSAHTPIMNRQGGVGFAVLHDRLGISNQLQAMVQGAYNLRMKKGYLRLGLRMQWTNWSMRYNDTNPDQQADDFIPQADLSEHGYNGGFGAMYHTKDFYIGISAPRLLENQWQFTSTGGQTGLMTESRHFYFMGGKAFKFNPNLIFKPAVMVRYVDGAPMQYDLNASLFINDTFWVGASYRWTDSIDVLFEYAVTREMRIGYAFDWTISRMRNHLGTHELFVGFDLKKKRNGYNHPRYF